jgi:hypothetical protein
VGKARSEEQQTGGGRIIAVMSVCLSSMSPTELTQESIPHTAKRCTKCLVRSEEWKESEFPSFRARCGATRQGEPKALGRDAVQRGKESRRGRERPGERAAGRACERVRSQKTDTCPRRVYARPSFSQVGQGRKALMGHQSSPGNVLNPPARRPAPCPRHAKSV